MLKTKFVGRRLLIGIILLLFVILLVFLITDGYFNLDRDIKIYSADAVDIIDQRMKSLLFEVNIFPQYVGDDLVFLSRLSSLKKVISSEGSNEEAMGDLENDFLEFLKEGTAYYQLGYIDKEENEIVKVEFGSSYKVISKESLQNKKGKDYFTETIRLDEGEVFISKLYLGTENGETKNNPTNVPFILSATPVFNENQELNGIVFLSFYADYFLDDIRNFQRPGEEVFLIDEEGYYLAHPDREKEFAFVFERDDNIYNDYPEISKEILLDYNRRKFETDDLIFSFKYIYPTAGDFWVHKGSEGIFGENPEENYFWILVSVSDKNEINNMIKELRSGYIYFLLFSGLIVFIIVLLIFIAVFREFDDKDSKRKK